MVARDSWGGGGQRRLKEGVFCPSGSGELPEFCEGAGLGKEEMRSRFRGAGDREEKGPGLKNEGGEEHVSGKELFFFLFTEYVTWGSSGGVWEPMTAADI